MRPVPQLQSDVGPDPGVPVTLLSRWCKVGVGAAERELGALGHQAFRPRAAQ